ncbi:MAG: Fic family protein [Epsilonproteobacteria bacterium]|nr:MAG: Fic family protein [Campylobacterota bacterium]
MKEKKWIWEHADYPNFQHNHTKLDTVLSQVSRNTGILEGTINTLNASNTISIQLDAVTNEILASSEIEGEILNRDSVRSSVRKKLDVTFDYTNDRSTHHTDGLVDVLIDSSFNHEPLTEERLHGWHNALFPTGYSGMTKIDVAKYREEEMSVVSGRGIKEKTHYIAPPHDTLTDEMHAFLEYINHSKDNPYVKSAIAHLWFVIIHPYDDGNGRLTRAISNYVLSKELGLNHKYFSISSAVMKDKKNYYASLEKTNKIMDNKSFDFTAWILWHTSMINSAINISLENIQTVVEKTKFWDKSRSLNLNEKQTKVLNKLLDAGEGNFEGGLTNKKYRGITSTTQVTASRHIKELVDKGLLHEVEGHGGRSTCYDIVWNS